MLYFDTRLYSEGPAFILPVRSRNVSWNFVDPHIAIQKIEYLGKGRRDPYELNTQYDFIIIDTQFSEKIYEIDSNDIQYGFVPNLLKSWERGFKLKSIGV